MSDVIRGFCRTNLDDYRRTRWPDCFVFPPRVGDKVRGRGSNRPGMDRPVLTIVSVAHYVDDAGTPMVEVELHR